MTDQSVSDGLAGVINKLDTSFCGSDLTEITHLQQQQITLALPNLTSKDVRTIVFAKKEFMIEEISTPTSSVISKHLMVGDLIVKVNGKVLDPRAYINNMLTATNHTTVVLRRRMYATVPDENRLRNTLADTQLTRQKGFAYQVITCNKMCVRQEKLVTSTFGFLAVVLGEKFVVVKIAEHSAAEKFFSIGDALLDLNGRSLSPSEKINIHLINPAFQKNGEISILIERPVTSKARRDACNQMRKYLTTPSTEDTMALDAATIGANAARYHHTLWKRLVPTPILVNPTGAHKASPKKKTSGKGRKIKSGKPDEEGKIDQSTMSHISNSNTNAKVIIDPKKSFNEICTDVTDIKELESVGSRYGDEFTEKDDKKQKKKGPSLFSFLAK